MTSSYSIDDIETLDSPALVVFPQRAEENIRQMVGMIDDPARLRPHIKTHKTAEGVKLMQSFGINKFKCATIAEAELLGLCKAKDALLAYQPVGPKIDRLIKLIRAYPDTRYSCLTDNRLAADAMSSSFAAAGITVPVYIDLNTGMNRTGIAPDENALDLYRYLHSLPGIHPAGLHAYDGHIRNKDLQLREIECNNAFLPVEELREKLIGEGFDEPKIIAGGSPTFPIHAARKDYDCSPGTSIFWDKGYSDYCSEQPFQPAVVLITRVISLPAPNRVCLDLGHKSVAAENEISKRVYFPQAPELVPVGQSEEHLVMEAPPGHTYKPGDVLYGIPYHICPTVALHERMITVENRKITGEWKVVARNRRISI